MKTSDDKNPVLVLTQSDSHTFVWYLKPSQEPNLQQTYDQQTSKVNVIDNVLRPSFDPTYTAIAGAHGFSVDTLLEADVVLVNGDLITASATNQYNDLFRALKGGANRFGIVTRYEVRAVHVGTKADKNFIGGTIFYDNSTSEALLKATAKFINNVNDPRASLLSVFSVSFANNTLFPINFATFVYNTSSPSENLPPGLYDDFLNLPNLGSSVGRSSYVDVVNSLGTGTEGSGQGQLFGASAFSSGEGSGYARYEDSYRKFGQYVEAVRAKPDATGPPSSDDDPTKDGVEFAILAFTSVQKSQVQVGRDRGGNVMDPPLRNYGLVQFHNQMPPNIDTVSRRVQNARREFLRQIPPSPGIPLYVGESDKEQNVLATYGRYQELRRTYRKYDPTRFNVRYTDGPIGL
ncbi:hypothetical protein H1R20_g4675, partial [Candolleomyces eurysporus]